MQKTNPSNGNTWLGAGLLAAVGASVCCIVPLIALLAGIGGLASSVAWLETLRPWLIAFTILALGLAWFFKLKPTSQTDCACDDQPKSKFMQSKKFLVLVSVIAIAMLAFPSYASLFYGKQQSAKTIQAKNAETIEVQIKGMTCSGCEAHVNNEVNKLEGVFSVKTSYDNGSAIVKYDPAKTDVKQITGAIKKTGYSATKTIKK